MNEISTLFVCLQPLIDGRTLRHLDLISHALLTMMGKATGLKNIEQVLQKVSALGRIYEAKIAA